MDFNDHERGPLPPPVISSRGVIGSFRRCPKAEIVRIRIALRKLCSKLLHNSIHQRLGVRHYTVETTVNREASVIECNHLQPIGFDRLRHSHSIVPKKRFALIPCGFPRRPIEPTRPFRRQKAKRRIPFKNAIFLSAVLYCLHSTGRMLMAPTAYHPNSLPNTAQKAAPGPSAWLTCAITCVRCLSRQLIFRNTERDEQTFATPVVLDGTVQLRSNA